MDTTTDLAEHTHSESDGFKTLAILSGIWIPFYVPYWISWDWLVEGVGVLAAVAGLPGALVWLFSAAFYKSPRMLASGIAIAALSALVVFGFGERLKAHATLAIHRNEFSAKVQEALKSPVQSESDKSNRFFVERTGGSVMVAFDLDGGFIDDFPTIVFDAKGTLKSFVNHYPPEDRPFQGQYSRLQHLRGPWYFVVLYPDVPVQ